MSFSERFNFRLPSVEEIQAVMELAESSPEDLDGRDMWIYRQVRGDFYE